MITYEEYLYLTDHDLVPQEVYQDVGLSCFAEGLIDVFGLVTPKGDKAIEEFSNDAH